MSRRTPGEGEGGGSSPYRELPARTGEEADPRSAHLVRVLPKLAALRQAMGRDAEAVVLYERALDLAEGVVEEAQILASLGVLYGRAGRRMEAERALGRALAVMEQEHGTGSAEAAAVRKLVDEIPGGTPPRR